MTEIAVRQPSTPPVRAGLTPAAMEAKVRYAQELATAGLLPQQYRQQPGNVLWAMEYGEALGLTPVAAIEGIDIINGSASASAGLISGLVRQAGHRMRIWTERDAKGNPKGIATIHRCDDPDFEYRSEWTMERAQQARLSGKDTWKQFPVQMLKHRATTEVARDACEEVLYGLHYTPEELGAEVDEQGHVVSGGGPGETIAHALGEEDSQPEEPAVPHELMTRMGRLMREAGLTTAQDALSHVAGVIGREIESRVEMTAEEVERVIEDLEPAPAEPRQAPADRFHGTDDDIVDGEVVDNPADEAPQSEPESAPEPPADADGLWPDVAQPGSAR